MSSDRFLKRGNWKEAIAFERVEVERGDRFLKWEGLERGDRFLNEGIGKRRSLFEKRELERGDRFLRRGIGERRSL